MPHGLWETEETHIQTIAQLKIPMNVHSSRETNRCQHVSVGISLPLLRPASDCAVFCSRQREPRHPYTAIVVPKGKIMQNGKLCSNVVNFTIWYVVSIHRHSSFNISHVKVCANRVRDGWS